MTNLAGKIAYKPISLGLGAAAGALSGLIFKQLWTRAAHDQHTPTATDEHRGWGEVLAAAALQGAIFALVKAAISRGGATGIRKATGRWPT
jgi:Protein of unknown function (DUF4235)